MYTILDRCATQLAWSFQKLARYVAWVGRHTLRWRCAGVSDQPILLHSPILFRIADFPQTLLFVFDRAEIAK